MNIDTGSFATFLKDFLDAIGKTTATSSGYIEIPDNVQQQIITTINELGN